MPMQSNTQQAQRQPMFEPKAFPGQVNMQPNGLRSNDPTISQ